MGHIRIILCHTKGLDSIGNGTPLKDSYAVMSSLEINFLNYTVESRSKGPKTRGRETR